MPIVAAVIGCGGKTSLIKKTAAYYKHKKILISPTTKMYPPEIKNADCRGILNPNTGKLEALPPDELAKLVSQYDLTLLEADGSRSLPCKGWKENEPVIPSYCTHTIGLASINALGKAADSKTVHNLAQFLAITGLQEGEAISQKALQKMIYEMFKNSVGERIIFINQAESQESIKAAQELLLELKKTEFFAKLLYGSINNEIYQEV